jgi:tRNA-dihydrouridine synthase
VSSKREAERNFAILKRFFKIYTTAFKGAAHLRAALMETHNANEVRAVLDDFEKWRRREEKT